MIRQLVKGIFNTGLPAALPYPAVAPGNLAAANEAVLTADPLDLTLYMEQYWDSFSPSAGPARRALWAAGRFNAITPPAALTTAVPSWDHLTYSYVLENTRASQILRRVVHAYRSGESLGVPSLATRQWLDVTESLLAGAGNLIPPWLSTSATRRDPEGVRRNAYWRLLGMELAFGTDDNRGFEFEKASAANTDFVRLFEELLFELWRAIANRNNLVAGNETDQDRIFRIAQELQFVLNSRRQGQVLDREELAAATVMGWIELTLNAEGAAVIRDLKADSTSPANRLKLIGNRVGLQAHSKSAAMFSMSEDLSILFRTIETAVLTPATVTLLYTPGPVAEAARRVITEWSAATGRDLKARAKPADSARPRLVAVQ